MATMYKDANGREVVIKSITTATLRKAKANGIEWLSNPQAMFERLGSPVDLADAISVLSGESKDSIDAGLSGDAIEAAQDAVVGAIAAFFPSRAGEQLRQALIKAREIERIQAEAAMAELEKQISSIHASSSPALSGSALGDSPSES